MDSDDLIASILAYIQLYQAANPKTSYNREEKGSKESLPNFRLMTEIFILPNGHTDSKACDYFGRMLWAGKFALRNDFEVINRVFFEGTGKNRKIGVTNFTNFKQKDFLKTLQMTYASLPPCPQLPIKQPKKDTKTKTTAQIARPTLDNPTQHPPNATPPLLSIDQPTIHMEVPIP